MNDNQVWCEVCEQMIDIDEDGNGTPCGCFNCPEGILRDDNPRPLDFDNGYEL